MKPCPSKEGQGFFHKGHPYSHKQGQNYLFSWSELIRQLEYKAAWYGREIISIDRWYPSSKRCSTCGFILKDLSLKTRSWLCPGCGAHHDRDINAARNILAAGLAVSARRRAGKPRSKFMIRAQLDELGIPFSSGRGAVKTNMDLSMPMNLPGWMSQTNLLAVRDSHDSTLSPMLPF